MTSGFRLFHDLWTAALAFLIATGLALASPAAAQDQPSQDNRIKRAFLDRYLDCAEAPNAAARLRCYDDLLADIPDWLAEPDTIPSPPQDEAEADSFTNTPEATGWRRFFRPRGSNHGDQRE